MAKKIDYSEWSLDRQKEYLDNMYLELGDTYGLEIDNPFLKSEFDGDIAKALVGLSLNKEYLGFFAKAFLNTDLFPYQLSILQTLSNKRLPILIASRGGAKTTMLALYCIVRAVLDQGVKIVIAGAGLRQSGLVFASMHQIWNNAPILRDIVGGDGPKRTILGYEWNIGNSKLVGVPLGSGEKIRGLRANVIVCDEFSSINPDVFETVLRGFAAVQSHNTFSKVQDTYRKKALMEMGLTDIHDQLIADEHSSSAFGMSGNQIILSGTCSYQFNHFYKYFDDYKRIITNRGIMENGATIEDWKEYAIIRIPYDHLPMGLMDETILEQGAAIMDNIIFRMEYGAVFPKDSAGFYPASVINSATCPMKNADGSEIRFSTELYGDSAAQYVMGIDPASERDNLTINITRLFDGYRGCVYAWSTNRRRFEEDKKANPTFYTDIFDYNTFIVRKIRDLCSRFNITRIHLDCGGGGRSIIEGLKDPSKLQNGESLLLDMDDPEVSGIKGMHIIKLCQFTNREWYENAHYNLLKDLTAKNYIFAEYDYIGIEKARIDPNASFGNMMIDTHEIVAGELEQTKYQTTLIEESSSAKGMKKWDLPKLIGNITGDIKARIRKDHFTALLLANDAGRAIINAPEKIEYSGGMGTKGAENLANYHNSVMYQGRGLKSMSKESSNIFKHLRVDQRESGDGSVYY